MGDLLSYLSNIQTWLSDNYVRKKYENQIAGAVEAMKNWVCKC